MTPTVPLPTPQETAECQTDASLDGMIREIDRLFTLWSGCVNLMEMAQALPERRFRLYIELSREQRRRKREALGSGVAVRASE